MMNKLLYFIEKINLLLLVFLVFGVKAVLVPATLETGLVLFVFGLVYSFGRYMDFRQPEKLPNKLKTDFQKVSEEVKEIKAALSKVNLSKITKTDKRYFS